MDFRWDEASIAKAVRLWISGMTAFQIAEALSTHTDRLSRSAVLGKLGRLGVKREEGEKRVRAPKLERVTPAPKPKPAPVVKLMPVAKRLAPPSFPLLDLTNARQLRDLEHGDCHFPLDDPGFGEMHRTLFCGASALPGEIYCHHHQRLALRWPDLQKRA